MPYSMWHIFRKSFENNLDIFGVDSSNDIMKNAYIKYREIISTIPEYKKNDVLLVSLLSAAMLASVYLSLNKDVTVNQVKEYYRSAMNSNKFAVYILKNENYYSSGYQNKLKKDAYKSQKATNPYTWRFVYTPGDTIDSFDAVFDKCGICELFKSLGISHITPALCSYDYDMAKFTNSVFTRESTIAAGGSVCDCHYKRRS